MTEKRGKHPSISLPVIAARSAWGCPDGEGNPRTSPIYTAVTHLIVHHTATANEAADWAAFVRSIWSFHVFTRGWSDIGYNYLIDPNGIVYEGRSGGPDVQGAHFICANAGTMGVALLGAFDAAPPADAALESLTNLLAWKCAERGIDPLGASLHEATQLYLMNISGHRDGNAASTGTGACPAGTECPGAALYSLLPQVRREVARMLGVEER
ncbi:MAG: N-acetylmuramoyl-L-alanine amidase [Acidobacteria bacterium]|nr:N-acetylmuramoyl-L-alanine amidase [Acidobacteriota bacterium]